MGGFSKANSCPLLGVILSEAKDLCIFPAPKYMDSSAALRLRMTFPLSYSTCDALHWFYLRLKISDFASFDASQPTVVNLKSSI
jgi:hypothetical protein